MVFNRICIGVMVITAVGFDAFGLQRTARINRQAVSVNQNAAVTAQTNCVNAPAMPDIVLYKLEVSNGASVTKPAPGQTYEITALLENRGQCETGSFKVQISVHVFEQDNGAGEDRVILDKLVQSMLPARDKNPEYTRVSVTYTLSSKDNTAYQFYATADPDNRIKEFIENNNGIERGDGINLDARSR